MGTSMPHEHKDSTRGRSLTSTEQERVNTYKYFYKKYKDFEKENPDEADKFKNGVAKFVMEKLIPAGSPYPSFPGAIWLQVSLESEQNNITKEEFINSLFEPSKDEKGQAHFMLSKLDMFNYIYH